MSHQSSAEINPGSFNDFTSMHSIDPSSLEAKYMHSEALSAYRAALAAEQNMSLEDLHQRIGNRVINISEAA